jgi:hypothetical protein
MKKAVIYMENNNFKQAADCGIITTIDPNRVLYGPRVLHQFQKPPLKFLIIGWGIAPH